MNADGTGKTQLTSSTGSTGNGSPSWNGSGDKIIYSYWNGTLTSLYMWDVTAGTSSVFLTGTANYDSADWLHKTYDIVYTSNKSGNPEIWKTKSTDSTQQVQVTNLAGSFTYISPPKWSPDGSWIAFSGPTTANSHGEVYVIKSDGTGGAVKLTNYNGSYDISGVDFGAANDWVYFRRCVPTTNCMLDRVNINTLVIETVNADTTKTVQSFDISDDGLYRLEMRENGCCWSPNIYTVLYDLNAGTNSTIFAADGNTDSGGRFSPNNQKIVYSQNTGYQNPSNLWIMNADGTDKAQLTSSTGSTGNASPSWNGSGDKIIYSYWNGTLTSLYMWDVAAGNSSAFLTGTANYDSADWLH
jgi:Tol biopolymer transport system component